MVYASAGTFIIFPFWLVLSIAQLHRATINIRELLQTPLTEARIGMEPILDTNLNELELSERIFFLMIKKSNRTILPEFQTET